MAKYTQYTCTRRLFFSIFILKLVHIHSVNFTLKHVSAAGWVCMRIGYSGASLSVYVKLLSNRKLYISVPYLCQFTVQNLMTVYSIRMCLCDYCIPCVMWWFRIVAFYQCVLSQFIQVIYRLTKKKRNQRVLFKKAYCVIKIKYYFSFLGALFELIPQPDLSIHFMYFLQIYKIT